LRKKSVLLVFVLANLALLGAGPSKLLLSWKNPSYTGPSLQNIMVLALNGKAGGRADFEDAFVQAISRTSVRVRPSYEYLPRPDATPINPKDLRELIQWKKFDGIVVARLTKADQKTVYVPGQVYSPYPYYGTFYGYYGALYPVVYSPGYLKTEKKAQVEVNLYSTAAPDGQLVWTGSTDTFEVNSVSKAIKELVKAISKELEKQNIIPPPLE